MNEIKKLIEKTIAPPGIQKPNRRALFGVISDVFSKVGADALTAFNAHFPYLADAAKLEEHGRALLVPRLKDDTEAEYRERVSAASFFLMRAGERAYITGQLDAHFGGRYVVSDEFLHIYVKVMELDDADRRWLLEFLDGLVNPNVKLSVAEWFHFVEKVITRETLAARARTNPRETFNDRSVKLNGRVKLDGKTVNATEKLRIKLDGGFRLNGAVNLSGALLTTPATGIVRLPVKLGRGILDMAEVSVKPRRTEVYAARIKLNGAIRLDGSEKLSGFGRVNDAIFMVSQTAVKDAYTGVCDTIHAAAATSPRDRYRLPLKLNGKVRLDGYAKLDGYSGVTDKVLARGAVGYFETYRARLKLNGAVKLDGCEGLSGFAGINDRVKAGLRYCRKINGQYRLDGSIKLNGGILIAV
ncbi:MAG: hypothetical protein LBO04_02485 [Spirochaetaceae bacterium]|jgi:hypothetical protein|nr:hypothetical protein [Spirochaetaceae bacterium]